MKFIALVAGLLAFAPAALPSDTKLEIALTFDDMPLNGVLPPGMKQSELARDTVRVLKKHRVPPSHGFINARHLERDPDGAQALQVWIAAGHPLANHTYSHLDLTENPVEEFQKDILRNEPALGLLTPPKWTNNAKYDWHWFRYPYLHEGDTLEKRRAIRAFLASRGYRIAQTTIDWEDYLWNSAHARCVAKQDAAAIDWLRSSYLAEAQRWMRAQRDFSRQVWGRDIRHVALLHLGSFSPHILPDLFELLGREGYRIVTLEQAQSDPIYASDPDIADAGGGTLTQLMMQAKGIPWPEGLGDKPREQLTHICK
ncbi:MAG TPA: polysaccharide deacetylase family protein [Steroidobacteraceae bacterium]|nr:polysaccharide deacetylase family protein [Steroidobacteraceae bacterium]